MRTLRIALIAALVALGGAGAWLATRKPPRAHALNMGAPAFAQASVALPPGARARIGTPVLFHPQPSPQVSTPLAALAFREDGARLFSVHRTLREWDARSGAAVSSMTFAEKPGAWPRAVAIARDGSRVAIAQEDGIARVIGREGRETAKIDLGARNVAGHLMQLQLVGDRLVALVLGTGKLECFDATGALVWAAPAVGRRLAFAASPDGSEIAATIDGGGVEVFDAKSGASLRTFATASFPYAIAWDPDGERLAVGQGYDGLALFARSGRAIGKVDVRWPIDPRFSADGARVACGGLKGEVAIVDVATLAVERRIAVGPGLALVAFSPTEARLLATMDEDGLIELRDVATGASLSGHDGHSNAVTGVAFSPDGKTLATSSLDRTLRVWDVATAREVRALAVRRKGGGITSDDPLSAVAFSPDGAMLAAGAPQIVWVFDVESWKKKLELPHGQPVVHALAFSPDARSLAVALIHAVWLFDLAADGELRHSESTSGSRSLAFSPDGKLLAIGEGFGEAALANGHNFKHKAKLNERSTPEGWVHGVAFSRDGTALALALGTGFVRVFDVASGRETRAIRAHAGEARSIAWSGDAIAAGGEDGTIAVFDATSGAAIATLRGHDGPVCALAFSPDGATLASGSDDGTAILWNAPARR